MSPIIIRSNQVICRKLFNPVFWWSIGPPSCQWSCPCSCLVKSSNQTLTRSHYFTVLHHYYRKMTYDGKSGSNPPGSGPGDCGGGGTKFEDPDVKVQVPAEIKAQVVNQNDVTKIEDLAAPTNCCMTGCANCVWIEYVEQLAKFYSDPSMSRDRVRKEIAEIDDFMIKGFLELELKTRGLL